LDSAEEREGRLLPWRYVPGEQKKGSEKKAFRRLGRGENAPSLLIYYEISTRRGIREKGTPVGNTPPLNTSPGLVCPLNKKKTPQKNNSGEGEREINNGWGWYNSESPVGKT